jgi:hypothetical protein
MKIHKSTLALFIWGFMMLIAGLSYNTLMIGLAVCGLCYALYWHVWHLKSEKELKECKTDIIRTYYLKDGTRMQAVIKSDFEIVSKSLFATLEQVEELRKKISIQPTEWFKKGQNSIKRKNKSGCCCIINDDDEIESLCGAHEAYIQDAITKENLF